MENAQFLWWKMDSLVWMRGKTNQNRCILSVIMWPPTLPINIHNSRRSVCLLLYCFFNLCLPLCEPFPPFLLRCHSCFSLPLPSVWLRACLPLRLPVCKSAACSHSLQTFWAEQGQMGSGFWETHPPPTHTHTIIPNRLARSLHRSQHVHTYINIRVYMRTHSCSYAQESWERSFLPSFCSRDTHVSPRWVGWGLWSDLKDIFIRPQVQSCPWCVSFSFSWNLSAQSRCCDGAQCHPIFLPCSPFFYVLALDWIKCDGICAHQVHICALSSQLKLLLCFIAQLNDSKRLLLCIHFSTRKRINFHQGRHLTCTRSVREIRLRQGTGECNYMGFVYFSFRLIWTSGVIMLDTKRRGVFHA